MVRTHDLAIAGDTVVKRYTSWDRGEPGREWQALTVLHRHHPGLGPRPYSADLTGDPPSVTMSRVPGHPLDGRLDRARLDALELAVRQLWSTPAGELPPRRWHPSEAQGVGRSWYAGATRPAGIAGEAFDAAVEFFQGPGLADSCGPPVFGHSDSNLANYLWDGGRIRVIDFEDAGWSDPAYELASLVEHLSARDTDWAGFLDRFDVDAARLRTGRFLAAALWLHMLLPGGRSEARNPPGTLARQARRLLDLA